MSTFIQILIFLIISPETILCAPQEIEIFPEPDYKGNSIILREKIPDLKDWMVYLNNAKSYCVTGVFDFFTSTNFTGPLLGFFGNGGAKYAFEQTRCQNYSDFYQFNSARFPGPADTRTKAIALYGGTIDHAHGGIEILIDRRAATNFPLATITAITTNGESNWTIYNEDNFQGGSFRLGSEGNVVNSVLISSKTSVRSVLMECNWYTERNELDLDLDIDLFNVSTESAKNPELQYHYSRRKLEHN